MNDDSTRDRSRRRFEVALAARNFEIELFWKRSLFFWGFVGATLVGYATLKDRAPTLASMLACFGWVCSIAWTAANRGSKYWFENWEKKVQSEEHLITGPLFADCQPPEAKGWWLSARRMSVSKLTIALSDYVVGFWTILVVGEAWELLVGSPLSPGVRRWGLLGYIGATALYALVLLRAARTTKTRDRLHATRHAQRPDEARADAVGCD